MTATETPRLLTTGLLATRLGLPLHRVLHILATRPHIQPAARAGTLRLYTLDALDAVRREIDARRDHAPTHAVTPAH
jgi:hypothetical protein